MSSFSKMALPSMGALALAVGHFSAPMAHAQSSPPPLIAAEIQHAQSDFAAGGIRRLSTNWYACIDQAQSSQDANLAERCVVYGYGALLLGTADATPWVRHLTPDIVAPGQYAMAAIMGIPEGPRQAWLDRYREWVSESVAAVVGDAVGDTGTGPGNDDAQDRGTPRGGPPYGVGAYGGDHYGGTQYGGRNGTRFGGAEYDGGASFGPAPRPAVAYDDAAAPYGGARYGGGANGGGNYRGVPSGEGAPFDAAPRPATAFGGGPYGYGEGRGIQRGQDLARLADGKYPREALQEPAVADALRQLAGPALLSHLKDYSFASPMEFTGRYAVGAACEPRACGVSEARFVFASDAVWIGIIKGGRMRIYGNPPRPARALLLRDRNRTVWRGPVEDMTHPVVAQVIQASADPFGSAPSRATAAPRQLPVATGPVPGGPLRMTISPHPFPAAAQPAPFPPAPATNEQAPGGQADGNATEVRLHNRDGTFEVPVTINGAMTLPFAIDSGSSDVSVSAGVMEKLIQAGTVSRADILGKQTYHLADGSSVSNETFRIHVLKVGDREVRDVMGSVTNDTDSLLLGQSFLTRFRSWSIDNRRQVLVLN
jgi:hypothetical protein